MMNSAIFILHGSLNDFLHRTLRGTPIPVHFQNTDQTAKHLIESLGVPHVEIGEASANGRIINLAYCVQDGDTIEVTPAPPGCPVEPRFLLDIHLGRLAAHLRMLGFDCLYRNDYEDGQMAEILATDNRILLTRDRQLLMRKVIQYGYCLRSLEPEDQLVEVVCHFALLRSIQPFHRCLRCNGEVEAIPKEAVLERLESLTRKYYTDFSICKACSQVYWKGSHYDRMLRIIENLQTDGRGVP
jgi:uncharacterized protein